jgi:hypothetical protein
MKLAAIVTVATVIFSFLAGLAFPPFERCSPIIFRLLSLHPIWSRLQSTAHFPTAWVLFASLTCRPNGPGSTRCLAFLGAKKKSGTESLQLRSPVSRKQKFMEQRQNREAAPETVPAARRDFCRATKPANGGCLLPVLGNLR